METLIADRTINFTKFAECVRLYGAEYHDYLWDHYCEGKPSYYELRMDPIRFIMWLDVYKNIQL